MFDRATQDGDLPRMQGVPVDQVPPQEQQAGHLYDMQGAGVRPGPTTREEATKARTTGAMRFNPDDYVDVQERIVRFWEEYPEGAIRTELASPASSFTEVVFRAEVYKDRALLAPDAVGYAAEKPGNGANQTSWHENCETSAIGRALANMGYATSRSDRPSRQEMRKVERSQPEPQVQAVPQQGGDRIAVGGMTDQQRKMIWAVATKEKGMTDADIESLCQEMFGVELKALDKPQASQLIDRLKGSEAEASPHPMVQTAIDNREANYLAAIEGAGSIGELRKVGEQIAGAGIKSDALTEAYKKQRAMLEERAA